MCFLRVLLLSMVSFSLYAIPSFPGAEGYGASNPGGRGGKVYIVTTLNGSGAGSFNAAIKATVPRTVVFRVSGVINQTPDIQLLANNSNLTIAGQTSPGGITIRAPGGGEAAVWTYASQQRNMIFRFLRFRASSAEGHALMFQKFDSSIIDHCDFSGGSDETLDICNSQDFTVQWSTVANSSTCSGCQNYGFLIAYLPSARISLHHMLMANHSYRAPEMHWTTGGNVPDNGMIDYRNNVVYNYQNYFMYISPGIALTGPLNMNVVSNYFKAGPNTSCNNPMSIAATAQVYQTDNLYVRTSGTTSPTGGQVASTAFAMPAVTTTTAQNAYTEVLAKVGAWPRDPMNTRTVSQVTNNTGLYGKIDDANITTGPAAPTDVDNDGIPDFWEDGMGLNKNDSADQRMDKDGDGYTNIEEYINDVALARLCQDYYNPVYPLPSDWPDYNPSCCKSLEIESHAASKGFHGGSISLFPNPVSGHGGVRIELLGKGHAGDRLQILDIAGKIAAEIKAGASIAWNGLDKDGLKLSAGVYLVRWIGAEGLRAQTRMLLVR